MENSKITLSLGAVFLTLALSPVHALTVTESTTAPTDFILAQPDFSAPTASYYNPDYSNQPPPAQTFTATEDFTLDGVTMKGGGSSNTQSENWVINISSLSGTTLTHLDSETIAYTPTALNDTDYLTFTLADPVALTAGQVYAFTIYNSSSGGGYFEFAKSATDVYSGGTAGTENNPTRWATTNGDAFSTLTGSGAATDSNLDRTFFLEGAVVPEPSTWAMMIGGLLLLVAWRRHREKV